MPTLSRPFPALRLAAPSQCEVCRQWGTSAVCGDCVARFSPPVHRCARCGLRLALSTPACGDCLRAPPPCTRTHAAVDYAFPWDRLVVAFKFEGRIELGAALADRLAAVLPDAEPDPPQCLLPVPLSPRRLAERGYNQAAVLARHLGRRRGLPVKDDLLQRPAETAHQADLDRAARQANLRTAFMVDPRRRAELQGLRVALVDDVMTTGATVREAASVLLRAGAAAVDVWVLARTPDA